MSEEKYASPLQMTCEEMVKTCKDVDGDQMSIIIRGDGNRPVIGIFCVVDPALAEIIEQTISDWDEN